MKSTGTHFLAPKKRCQVPTLIYSYFTTNQPCQKRPCRSFCNHHLLLVSFLVCLSHFPNERRYQQTRQAWSRAVQDENNNNNLSNYPSIKSLLSPRRKKRQQVRTYICTSLVASLCRDSPFDVFIWQFCLTLHIPTTRETAISSSSRRLLPPKTISTTQK